jgi:1,4-dihydroxy-2-naphthoate octaprenyltransferase
MLTQMMFGVETSDGLAIAIGALIAGMGSILFVMRTRALDEGEQDTRTRATGMRRVALRNVLFAYTVVAWICVVVTVIIGDGDFILLSALFAVLVSASLFRVLVRGDERSPLR